MPMDSQRDRLGLTLMELVVVLAVIAALGSIVVANLSQSLAGSREVVVRSTLGELRTAVLDHYRHDMYETLPRPVDPSRLDHPQLAYLFVNPELNPSTNSPAALQTWTFDPVSRRGWRGPYVRDAGVGRYVVNELTGFTRRYGEAGDPMPLDPWGGPVVLQEPQPTGVPPAEAARYARLVSAGPNGVLDTPPDVLVPSLAEQGDDLLLYLWVTP